MIIVLLNILLAIIADSYSESKEALEEEVNLVDQPITHLLTGCTLFLVFALASPFFAFASPFIRYRIYPLSHSL